MGVGVRRDDEVRGAQPAQDRLGRDRRVVVVVDEHVVERWLATEGFSGRALEDGREVGEVQRVEHLLVLTQEAGQLAPARQSPPIGGLDEALGREQRLLRPREELSHLVGEPAHAEQRTVGGPPLRILGREQFLHLRELLGRRQELGRLLASLLGPGLEDAVREPVHRHHVQARERGGQTLQQS